MAKSRRGRRAKSRRMTLDWVVNADSYGRVPLNITPAGGPGAVPLTYPKMMLANPIWGGGNIGGNAMPTDGDRQFVKAVSGHIYWRPSSWVAGNSLTFWARVVKKPMDLTTGAAIADALYALNDDDYANERFAWQYVNDEAFNTGNNFASTLRVKATVNQWLEPDEALYMMVQMDGVGVASLNVWFYLRTLMGIPG